MEIDIEKANLEKFGNRVKMRRNELKLTQREVAERVWPNKDEYNDYDPNELEKRRKNIVNYEKGTFPKHIQTLHDLCKVLECDFDYLLGTIDTPTHGQGDIRKITELSHEACKTLESASNNPCVFVLLNALLSAPEDLLEKIGKKYIQYRHSRDVIEPVVKAREKELQGKTVFADITINGDKIPKVPLQDVSDYARFELMRAFMEFGDLQLNEYGLPIK